MISWIKSKINTQVSRLVVLLDTVLNILFYFLYYRYFIILSILLKILLHSKNIILNTKLVGKKSKWIQTDRQNRPTDRHLHYQSSGGSKNTQGHFSPLHLYSCEELTICFQLNTSEGRICDVAYSGKRTSSNMANGIGQP